ncbi:MAG: STAS domain-containing protein [Acidimicrobiia bacterium]
MQGAGTAIIELDFATSPAFITATITAIDASSDRPVVVDCTAITFMDSSAYHAMAALTRYAAARGRDLIVSNLQPQCAWVLNFCNTDRELTIETAA